MTQAQTDDLMVRLDEQHDDLLRRLDDLDAKIAAVLEEWSPGSEPQASPTPSLKSAKSSKAFSASK